MSRVRTVVVDPAHEFALVARATYDRGALVHSIHKSTRPEKQRAEALTLVAGVLEWARAQGITVDADGTVHG